MTSDQTDDILAAGLDEDVMSLIMSDVYGITLGESTASAASSKSTGKRSRPTSDASTSST